MKKLSLVLCILVFPLAVSSCTRVSSDQAGTQQAPGAQSEGTVPSLIQQEVITLKAQDGGSSWGVLYTAKDRKPQTVAIAMHPRSDSSRGSFLVPLAEAGFAAFGQSNRHVLNDTDGIHEEMLLDIAAAVRFFKKRGFQKIVLIGQSGGGPLMAFYQSQAATPPPRRVSSTPAGDPPDLNKFELPAADGLLTVIPHLGEGAILEVRIDPSVTKEGDPLFIDPSLDMYIRTNGFRMPPEQTTYSKEFVARYRAAQKARMERLDQWAHSLIAEQKRYRSQMEQPEFKNLPPDQRQRIERNASTERMMTIYRTFADLRYMDLAMDPSDRTVGDNSGTTPWLANYASSPSPGFINPRAFLSSRSSVSSSALTLRNIAKVTVPTLIVQGTAHRAIYPSDTRAIFEAAGAKDKKLVWIEGGDVSFRPSGPKAGKGDQREQATNAVVSWMVERFPH